MAGKIFVLERKVRELQRQQSAAQLPADLSRASRQTSHQFDIEVGEAEEKDIKFISSCKEMATTLEGLASSEDSDTLRAFDRLLDKIRM